MAALAKTHRVVALRFPFFEDKTLISVRALRDYTAEFLEAQQLECVTLCGNSLGGQVALDFGLNFPHKVDKLVLTGSSGLWESEPTGEHPKATRAFIRQQAEKIFYHPKHVDETILEQVYQAVQDRNFVRTLLRLARDAQAYKFDDQLQKLRVQTLLIWGEEDRITPPDVARAFQQKIAHARLVFLPLCGHVPPLEQPQEFTRALQSFLAGPV